MIYLIYNTVLAVCSRINTSIMLCYTLCISRYSQDEAFYLLNCPHRSVVCDGKLAVSELVTIFPSFWNPKAQYHV